MSGAGVKDFIDGKVLEKASVIKNLPFIIFLVVLGLYYIANRNKSERVCHHMLKLEKELKDLRFESITTASDLMYMSKQSEVLRRVKQEGLDLVESIEPPIKIYIEEEE